MKSRTFILLFVCLLSSGATAGEIKEGVLLADGKPFFPLGSWNFDYTTPQDIDRLGMNTSFRGGPSTAESVEQFRGFMSECNDLGIQVVPYLSYGGAGVDPWPPDSVRAISRLATEPNLLAWYVGDDIGMPHLPGIKQTVDILREETPSIPTVADYIAKETPQAKTVFTQYIDIRCQYAYPIPDESYTEYLEFFDQQRAFVGDPLWTWVQSFMWGKTGKLLKVGAEGPGPIPDPEQVRLLSFAAINRGVRGLLFFPHHELHRLPELAAEVALTCREIRLLEPQLAAGVPTYNLPSSDPNLNATAFRYGESTVISAALFKPHYHRWVDEGVVTDMTVDCPWSQETLPQAFLVATPEVVECTVSPAPEKGSIRVTIPRLELAGFILLSSQKDEIERLRRGVNEIPDRLRTLVSSGATAQARKVCGAVWPTGGDNLYGPSLVMDIMRSVEETNEAVDRRDSALAVVAWRKTLRQCRTLLDETMQFAERLRQVVPASQRKFLVSPYGLWNIPGLGSAADPNDPWHFVDKWMVSGPFPLEWKGEGSTETPAGFERVYSPEAHPELGVVFETVDGPGFWRLAECDLSGLLDLLSYFGTTENVVCYARCRVVAPRDMKARISLGSNDGARVWVNGEDAFSWCSVPSGGRSASPHQDEFEVELKEGSNELLVKIENLGMNWQLYLSFDDPNRELRFEVP